MKTSEDLDALAAVLQEIGGSPKGPNSMHLARIGERLLRRAFDALDRLQIVLRECPSPLPDRRGLRCSECGRGGIRDELPPEPKNPAPPPRRGDR